MMRKLHAYRLSLRFREIETNDEFIFYSFVHNTESKKKSFKVLMSYIICLVLLKYAKYSNETDLLRAYIDHERIKLKT